MFSVDELAQQIRFVDGSHSLGAGALAEALMPFLEAALARPAEAELASDIISRLKDISQNDDHSRGCQGRQYECTCGYDARTLATADDAVAEIERLRTKLQEARDVLEIAFRRESVTRGELDVSGSQFGFRITKRPKGQTDLLELFSEDDEHWHYTATFAAWWLKDMIAVCQEASKLADTELIMSSARPAPAKGESDG